MSDLPSDQTSEVPWGRPPLPEVPVPPFTSAAEHVLFLRCLVVHVAASGDVPLQRNDVVLLTLLQDEADAIRWSGEDFPRHPSSLAMRIAVRSYFPAPWTPHGLVDALTAAGLRREWMEADAGHVAWGSDPHFVADRRDDGSWLVRRSERAPLAPYADLPDDDALVLLLLSHQRRFGFPLAFRTDGVPVEALIGLATRTGEAWARHATLPYLLTWAETVDRVRRDGTSSGR